MPTTWLSQFVPEIVLTVGALLVMLADTAGTRSRDALCRGLAVAALAVAFVAAWTSPASGPLWSGMIRADALYGVFRPLLIGASLLVAVIFSPRNSRELRGIGQGEFNTLLLVLTLSNLLLAGSADLVMLYLALEMVSITSYIMVAYGKGDLLSNEASLKYVLFGAVSTGVMLYGLSLVYGIAGTTSLDAVRESLVQGATAAPAGAFYVLGVLVVAGFAFKIAAAPFHFWCPDVYQGAPTPVAALLSVAPKAAGFAVMARFFLSGWPAAESLAPGSFDWRGLLMVVSAATMTLGNVAALTQTNMKRLLAYSSIGHAGFILMGLVASSDAGTRGIVVYLLVYLFMNLGAFFVVTLIHEREGTFDLRDYPGLVRRAPLLTLAMSMFLLSLMGLPPLVGFMAKFYVFAAVIERGMGVFALIGALNAALAAYYYFRVLRAMVIDSTASEKAPLRLAGVDAWLLTALAAANLVPMLFWSRIDAWAATTASFLVAR